MNYSDIFNWIFDHYIELLGTLFGLIYIYLSIKQNILLWGVGFITSAFYIYIYFVSKFYADMALQVYYLIISAYGLFFWLKSGRNNENGTNRTPILKLSRNKALILSAATFAMFIIISEILKRTDSPLPYWDAFTTSASITATWMLAHKYIEQWIIWIVVDLVSAFLYVYKELYATTFLFVVYTILAVAGYFAWQKSYRKQIEIYN